MRANLRGQINNRNLSQTDAERRVGQVLDAATRDIARDLGGVNPHAAALYRKADTAWKLAKREEKQVVERIFGPANNPKSGGDVVASIKSFIKSDTPRLERLWRMMGKAERDDFVATLAENLGRRSPDDDFSPALFVAQLRGIPVSARKVLFGEDGTKAVANLRALSRALTITGKRLNNTRSGAAVNWRQVLGGVLLGGGAGAASGSPTAAIAGAGVPFVYGKAAEIARYFSARALMNPDLTRWLTAAAQQNTPRAIGTHIERLGTIAARNPVIANDVLGLQQQLQQAFSQAPLRAAAAPGEEEKD